MIPKRIRHCFVLFILCDLLLHAICSPYEIPPDDENDVEDYSSGSEDDYRGKNPRVNRRGYAYTATGGSEEFFRKTAKTVPRIGRRNGPTTSSATFEDGINDHGGFFLQAAKNVPRIGRRNTDRGERSVSPGMKEFPNKRDEYRYDEIHFWPWYADGAPNTLNKRMELGSNCRDIESIPPNMRHAFICNENAYCCMPDPTELKRSQPSNYPGKQTGRLPNYKSNKFAF